MIYLPDTELNETLAGFNESNARSGYQGNDLLACNTNSYGFVAHAGNDLSYRGKDRDRRDYLDGGTKNDTLIGFESG